MFAKDLEQMDLTELTKLADMVEEAKQAKMRFRSCYQSRIVYGRQDSYND